LQELAELLKGHRKQTLPQGPSAFKEYNPKPLVKLDSANLQTSGEPSVNPAPTLPPPVPVEMIDVQLQTGEKTFDGRETWEVTFLATRSVRVEIHVMNAQGELEEPTTIEMSVERFFRTKSTWSPHIRSFKFQSEVLPPILSTAMDKIF
jgi:hypothetical protein